MKFSIGKVIGEMLEDQVSSRKFYIHVVKKGESHKKKHRKESSDCEFQMAKKLKMEVITEKTLSTQVQPVEELMNIELFPGKTCYVTKIRTHMLDMDARAIVACLRKNTYIFAFSSTYLKGVNTKIAMCSLNVDPTARHVK